MRGTTAVTGAVSLLALVATIVAPSRAEASYTPGTAGHDVSYPQCSSSTSSTSTVGGLGGAFGLVGVTGGRPFGPNACSGSEFAWAAALPQPPNLYMNTANPAPTSSYYWPASGASDPALCKDSTSTTDPGCAYDYGWHAAADALTKEAASITSAPTLGWWLDVEAANSWNGNGSSNAADLQGSVDYLRTHGVPSVGIYSTSSQWTAITGGYSASTVASYTGAWSSEFTAQYPMTASPLWVAGLGDSSSANTNCSSSFTGAPVWLAQYADGSGYDADLACPSSLALSFTPASVSATAGSPSPSVQVNLNTPAPAGGLVVTVSSTSAAGQFSTSPTSSTASYAPGPVALTIPAGAVASNPFAYEDTVAGTPTLTATASGWSSATLTDTVSAGPLATITVTASSTSVVTGGSDTLTAHGADAYKNPVPVAPAWSSTAGAFSSATGASVTYVAPSQPGQVTVTATQSGIAGSTVISVTAPPALAVAVAKSGTTRFKGSYLTPVTITVSNASTGAAVAGAAVSWHAVAGQCPGSGSAVSSGSGTTSSTGSYGFRMSTPSTGVFCVIAQASASGYSAATGSSSVQVG